MKKNTKKRIKRVLVAGITVTVIGGTLYAASLLNWTGGQTLSEVSQYLKQMTVKLVNQNDKIKDMKDEADNLKNQIIQLEKEKQDLQGELDNMTNRPTQEDNYRLK